MKLSTLVSASALFSIGMLLGRVLGLLREMVIAARFGSSEEASIAIALLIIPDVISAALIGTAMGAVFLPAFMMRSPERVLGLFSNIVWVSIIFFACIAVLIGATIPHTPYRTALWIALASFPLIGATAALTVYLQHRERFAIPAFANAIFNVIVLGFLWFAPSDVTLLAIGTLIAVIIRLLAHGVAYILAKPSPSVARERGWHLTKPMITAYSHACSANILGILPIYLPYGIVALLSLHSFALFNYAFKLLVFPSTLIQTIIYMVILPWFVSARASSTSSHTQRYSLSLKLGWVISLALAFAVSLAGEDIARLCFGYGAMTEQDIAHVGLLLSIGIWSTPGIVMLSIWQQMLYAHEYTKPVLAANAMLVATLLGACTIGGIWAEDLGVIIGFIFSLSLPVIVLAYRTGARLGMTRKPSREYVYSSLAMALCFAPLAWMHNHLIVSPLIGLLLAVFSGLIMLGIGMLQIHTLGETWREVTRRWLRLYR